MPQLEKIFDIKKKKKKSQQASALKAITNSSEHRFLKLAFFVRSLLRDVT